MEHPDIVCDISAQDAAVHDHDMGVIPCDSCAERPDRIELVESEIKAQRNIFGMLGSSIHWRAIGGTSRTIRAFSGVSYLSGLPLFLQRGLSGRIW